MRFVRLRTASNGVWHIVYEWKRYGKNKRYIKTQCDRTIPLPPSINQRLTVFVQETGTPPVLPSQKACQECVRRKLRYYGTEKEQQVLESLLVSVGNQERKVEDA